MADGFRIAVLGATGLVGQQMIDILAERKFPVAELYPLASARSAGATVNFNGEETEVLVADDFDWSNADIAFFSAGGSISREFAPKAAEAGCVALDNTSEFRYEPDIPLVVPEVNAWALADLRNRNIIANPNCSSIQILVALKPIHDAVGIERINVATFQSVSG
ncbi:MAG: aspartate-semialdehyde dehydrogenase, partial [Idiomarina sp.]|nr:aspartate-semialdehyde dehydrogenase [Idiomarina sp.]